MSRIKFDNYGRLAREIEDPTVIGGRYTIQRRAERLIVMDVIQKLDIRPDDRLLEIGCGPGNLLIPLSFMVQSAVGIDHPDVCKFLQTRFTDPKIQTFGCNFLDYEPAADEAFDKVLVYSVVNTLSDHDEAIEFIDKAVGLVTAGGRFLLGDIANINRKERFLRSETGQTFESEWQKKLACAPQPSGQSTHPIDKSFLQQTDRFIVSLMERYRARGYDTFVMAQPAELPFGRTREDLLIVLPPK